jgi:hypothetical protein
LSGLGSQAVRLRRVSDAAQVDVKAEVASLLESLGTSLGQKFSSATADMANRLEQTKGTLRQPVTDRIQQGFSEIWSSVEQQLAAGRKEQTWSLSDGRSERTSFSAAHYPTTQDRISKPESADRAEPRIAIAWTGS